MKRWVLCFTYSLRWIWKSLNLLHTRTSANYKRLPDNSLCPVTSTVTGAVVVSLLVFELRVDLNVGGFCTSPATWDAPGCLLDMCRCRLLVLLSKHCIFFLQIRQRAAAKLSKRSKCLQIKLRVFRLRFKRQWTLASSSVLSSTGAPCAASRMPLMSAPFTVVVVSESPSSSATST